MDLFYIVMEVQDAGTPAILPNTYTDLPNAMAKYHTVLAAAAVSQVPYHACFLVTSEGVMTQSEVYDRRTASGA